MKFDLTELLQGWDYTPGQVAARRFQGKDGEKIQLRVDLGVLQMNAIGRPDGRKPMGHESWHQFQLRRLEQAGPAGDGVGRDFSLNAEDCSRLQQEAIQYHHRYICFFQLRDFEAVERDCARNLEVFRFVDEHAETDELAWTLLQFTPQLLMMRTRARGEALLQAGQHAAAIEMIEDGLSDLEGFYRENEREELLEQSGEIQSLRQWLEDIRRKRPVSELERLQRDLAEAIQIEDYEKAAAVRDQLRKLQASGA